VKRGPQVVVAAAVTVAVAVVAAVTVAAAAATVAAIGETAKHLPRHSCSKAPALEAGRFLLILFATRLYSADHTI
jgi:hypothetical protein